MMMMMPVMMVIYTAAFQVEETPRFGLGTLMRVRMCYISGCKNERCIQLGLEESDWPVHVVLIGRTRARLGPKSSWGRR